MVRRNDAGEGHDKCERHICPVSVKNAHQGNWIASLAKVYILEANA